MTDTTFDLALSLGEDVAQVYETPARPGPVEAGSRKAGGPVPKPEMPQPLGPPSFDEATAPAPHPTGPIDPPIPHPPPPFEPGEFPPPVIGEGQLYDVDHALWRALTVDCVSSPWCCDAHGGSGGSR